MVGSRREGQTGWGGCSTNSHLRRDSRSCLIDCLTRCTGLGASQGAVQGAVQGVLWEGATGSAECGQQRGTTEVRGPMGAEQGQG